MLVIDSGPPTASAARLARRAQAVPVLHRNGIDLARVEKGMPKSDWSFVAVAVAVSIVTASVPWLFLIKW